jgi:hypothetical protein
MRPPAREQRQVCHKKGRYYGQIAANLYHFLSGSFGLVGNPRKHINPKSSDLQFVADLFCFWNRCWRGILPTLPSLNPKNRRYLPNTDALSAAMITGDRCRTGLNLAKRSNQWNRVRALDFQRSSSRQNGIPRGVPASSNRCENITGCEAQSCQLCRERSAALANRPDP